MLGLSRLGYALSVNRQIPSAFGSLHRTRATPVGIIVFGAVTAIALLLPADLEFLAAICAFGATITFTIVGLSVIRLRWKEPDRDRPYKMPLNVRVRGGELPIPAVLCVAALARRVRRAAGRARRRSLVRRGLDGGRHLALPRLPALAGQGRLQARDRARGGADAAAPRTSSSARSSCPCSAPRSTTTSCRPPAGSPPRSATRTTRAR